MWLLETTSLELKEFMGRERPRYVILSHRWQGEELSLRDMKPKHREQLASRPGYAKVRAFCDKARDEGYQWAWVDTCCIDKKSSAELSEAINSMYQWYSDAGVCFAYLVDLPGDAGPAEMQQAFRSSEWSVL